MCRFHSVTEANHSKSSRYVVYGVQQDPSRKTAETLVKRRRQETGRWQVEEIIEEVRITRSQRKRKEEQMRQTERIEAEEGASALHPDRLAEKKRECIEEVNVETVGMDVITELGKVESERENVQTVRGEDDYRYSYCTGMCE